MSEKKGVNIPVIAVSVVAVALVGIAAVLGIKLKNNESVPIDATVNGDYPSYYYQEEQSTESIFSSITTTIAQVIGDTTTNTMTAPETTTKKKVEKTTQPTTKKEEATVPVLDEEDMSHGSADSNQQVVAPTGDLPGDMSFAGLMRAGYNVIGLKEYIYNDDTDPDCVQKNLGYNSLYDWGAGLIDFTIDTVKLPFTYQGKAYRIQLWKGQYISGKLGTIGGEVGLYTRPKAGTYDHYSCAKEEDWLDMEMTILWNENNDGVYVPQFTRNYSEHWWQTGYVDGALKDKNDSSDLRLLSRITFKDVEQAQAFAGALDKAGFTLAGTFNPEIPDTYKIYGKDVIYIWQDAR